MKRFLCTGWLLLVLASSCGGDPTAVLVHIRPDDGVELLVPTDLDYLTITVEVGGEPVWNRGFQLEIPPAPEALDESITFRPGTAASAEFEVVVEARLGSGGDVVAIGTGVTSFFDAKIREDVVRLRWSPGYCRDEDGDGHGRGPACLDEDCDDANGQVHPGATESCNAIDDDCDGATDEPGDLDAPRCQAFKGVCVNARKSCVGGIWEDCSVAGYGEDYEPVETTCDELDNDCDGARDEGCDCIIGQSRSCTGPSAGICEPGSQSCEGTLTGSWGEDCDGVVEPDDESCNQLDDDCDGDTDEDFDLQNDDEHCGSCNSPCGASLSCYQGQCLPACPVGWVPEEYDTQTICLSPFQGTATACEAYRNCGEAGARVGFGGDDPSRLQGLPPGMEDNLPGIVFVSIEQVCDGCDYAVHFVCYDAVGAWNGSMTFSCTDGSCGGSCSDCDSSACPDSNTACKQCGCALPYWCYQEIL